jgi:hypothetical protein
VFNLTGDPVSANVRVGRRVVHFGLDAASAVIRRLPR